MDTKQPVWKCIGRVGDVDPIAYGGGFIYKDETGVYGPEMTHFEPLPDEEWHKTEGKTPVNVYRVLLESGTREWWYEKLDAIASYTGQSLEELQADAVSPNPITLAFLYGSLISYFGVEEFDSYPVVITEDEAYTKYVEEMKAVR